MGLKLTGAKASSQLGASAAAKLVVDGDQTTAWRTGTPTPADQWIEVSFAPAAVSRIEIWNGWTRTKDLYNGNARPHNVTIRFTGGDAFPVALNDVFGPQKIDLPPEVGAIGVTSLRITILDWYPAKKTAAAGSPTKWAAISEIRLYGIATTP